MADGTRSDLTDLKLYAQCLRQTKTETKKINLKFYKNYSCWNDIPEFFKY